MSGGLPPILELAIGSLVQVLVNLCPQRQIMKTFRAVVVEMHSGGICVVPYPTRVTQNLFREADLIVVPVLQTSLQSYGLCGGHAGANTLGKHACSHG